MRRIMAKASGRKKVKLHGGLGGKGKAILSSHLAAKYAACIQGFGLLRRAKRETEHELICGDATRNAAHLFISVVFGDERRAAGGHWKSDVRDGSRKSPRPIKGRVLVRDAKGGGGSRGDRACFRMVEGTRGVENWPTHGFGPAHVPPIKINNNKKDSFRGKGHIEG